VIRALETAMTLPRPPIRTVEMRPLALRRTARRRALTVLLVGISIALAALVAGDSSLDVFGAHEAMAAHAVGSAAR
jgi:hypothetical protein